MLLLRWANIYFQHEKWLYQVFKQLELGIGNPHHYLLWDAQYPLTLKWHITRPTWWWCRWCTQTQALECARACACVKGWTHTMVIPFLNTTPSKGFHAGKTLGIMIQILYVKNTKAYHPNISHVGSSWTKIYTYFIHVKHADTSSRWAVPPYTAYYRVILTPLICQSSPTKTIIPPNCCTETLA